MLALAVALTIMVLVNRTKPTMLFAIARWRHAETYYVEIYDNGNVKTTFGVRKVNGPEFDDNNFTWEKLYDEFENTFTQKQLDQLLQLVTALPPAGIAKEYHHGAIGNGTDVIVWYNEQRYEINYGQIFPYPATETMRSLIELITEWQGHTGFLG